jgi:predicted ester cyclase
VDPAALHAFYERYIGRCNAHDFEGLGEFVARDVGNTPGGLAGYVDGLRAVVAAFPDYRWTVEEVVAEEGRIAARLTGRGTHLGPFRGVPPTGRVVETQELAMYRVADGRIAAVWGDLGSTVRDALVSGG